MGLDHEYMSSNQSKFVVTSKQKLPKPYKMPFPEKGKSVQILQLIRTPKAD